MPVSYATIEDFQSAGLPPGALGDLSWTAQQSALVRASAFADTYIGCKYTLPLGLPYDPSLTDAVCQIAAWRLMCLRGFNTDNPGDAVIRQGFIDARDWLVRIANGQARLAAVQGTPASLQPDITTNVIRGYSPPELGTDIPIAGSGGGGWGV